MRFRRASHILQTQLNNNINNAVRRRRAELSSCVAHVRAHVLHKLRVGGHSALSCARVHLRAACAWVQRALHLPDFIVGQHARERAFATLVELMATQHAACACPLCARRGSARARRCVSARNARSDAAMNLPASATSEAIHTFNMQADNNNNEKRPTQRRQRNGRAFEKSRNRPTQSLKFKWCVPGLFKPAPTPAIHIPYSSPSPIAHLAGVWRCGACMRLIKPGDLRTRRYGRPANRCGFVSLQKKKMCRRNAQEMYTHERKKTAHACT